MVPPKKTGSSHLKLALLKHAQCVVCFGWGPGGWGDCPFLEGQGFNLSSTPLFLFYLRSCTVNMDTVLVKTSIIPNRKKICCAEFLTLIHFSNFLTKNKPPHRLISQFTKGCKVHYYVFLYQGICCGLILSLD